MLTVFATVPEGPLLGVFCSEDDASWCWTSNLPLSLSW